MTLHDLRDLVAAQPAFETLRQTTDGMAPGQSIRIKGAAGSLPAFVLADLLEASGGPIVALLPESESADYLRSDLEQLLGSDDQVLFFPPTGHAPYDPDQLTDSLPLVQRADALGHLREGFDGILVTSVEAISEKVPPPDTVQDETMSVRVGDEVAPEALMERLTSQGFEPVEFVNAPGEVATRGGILDVYPFAGGFPIRLEFFGDEVDEIREFDPANQRSVSRLEVARLIPNLGETTVQIGTVAVTPLAFLPSHTPLVLFDSARMPDLARDLYDSATTAYEEYAASGHDEPVAPPETRYLSPESLGATIANHPTLTFGTFASGDADTTVDLGGTPQPEVGGDVTRLRQRLIERSTTWTQAILCDSTSQKNRLFEILAVAAE
ncbi:MAG: transcription-repair coupling factor, partial [Bacteroidota bacterium]